MLIVGTILYQKTIRMNWYNQSHITYSKKTFSYMVVILILVVSTDIFGLVSLKNAFYSPKDETFSWTRIAFYVLSIHFFSTTFYFSKATNLGFKNRNPSVSYPMTQSQSNGSSMEIIKG